MVGVEGNEEANEATKWQGEIIYKKLVIRFNCWDRLIARPCLLERRFDLCKMSIAHMEASAQDVTLTINNNNYIDRGILKETLQLCRL